MGLRRIGLTFAHRFASTGRRGSLCTGVRGLCRSGPRQNDGYDERRYLPTTDSVRGLVSALDRGSLGGPPFTGLRFPSSLLYSVAGALYHLFVVWEF